MTASFNPTAVVFDIGNVLVGWDPRNLYKNHFKNADELNWFLDEVVNLTWHTNHDRGLSFTEGCENLAKKHPKYKKEIYLFHSHWRQTISGPIEGSISLLKKLSEQGVPLFAISNYSAEKFPELLEEFSFMDMFDDIVISGEVGFVKPEPEIFEIAMDQFGLKPQEAVFVDDRLENIAAGEAFGLLPYHFSTPEKLENQLKRYLLL